MLTWVVDAGSQFTSVGHGGGLNECRVTDNVSSSSPCRQTGKGRKEGRKEPTPPIKKNNSIPKSSTVQNHFLSNTIAASVACVPLAPTVNRILMIEFNCGFKKFSKT
jgi:hypothetical protein